MEVPAKLIVDGKAYPGVGVHFRGASSYMMVGEGRKRSLNLSIDYEHEDQRLLGYRTVNLLNMHRDPTFLRTVLYYHIARHYLPAPNANYVRLVVNGESWGAYVNVQQFNKDFIKEWFSDAKGARWKVPGSPRGNAGLGYLGDDAAEYKKKYEIKTKDDPKAWSDLIKLSSYEAFKKGISEDVEQEGFRGPERALSLKNFAEQRRTYLLNYPEIKNAGK